MIWILLVSLVCFGGWMDLFFGGVRSVLCLFYWFMFLVWSFGDEDCLYFVYVIEKLIY
jgi:hypothetical protein